MSITVSNCSSFTITTQLPTTLTTLQHTYIQITLTLITASEHTNFHFQILLALRCHFPLSLKPPRINFLSTLSTMITASEPPKTSNSISYLTRTSCNRQRTIVKFPLPIYSSPTVNNLDADKNQNRHHQQQIPLLHTTINKIEMSSSLTP